MSARARLVWRCRRGARELDLLLAPFLEDCYERLPRGLQRSFAELLERPDPDLLDYLTGRAAPEAQDLAELVARIRAHGARDGA